MPRVQAWSLGPGHEGPNVALKLLPWFARADLALPGGGLSAPATGRRSCPCPGPGSHSHQSAVWPWEVSSLIMHPWQASEEYICSCMEHSYMHEHMNMCVASDQLTAVITVFLHTSSLRQALKKYSFFFSMSPHTSVPGCGSHDKDVTEECVCLSEASPVRGLRSVWTPARTPPACSTSVPCEVQLRAPFCHHPPFLPAHRVLVSHHCPATHSHVCLCARTHAHNHSHTCSHTHAQRHITTGSLMHGLTFQKPQADFWPHSDALNTQ